MANALSYTNQTSEIIGSQIKPPIVVQRKPSETKRESETKLQTQPLINTWIQKK
jgi:hypothetical protein